ncbi:MAG: carboxysome shell carbonic anhydrase [Thermochromatium sp.]
MPTLKSIVARVLEPGFEEWAQAEARQTLGFGLPESWLADAWVTGLDRRALFAHAVFETVRAMGDDYFTRDPLNDRGQSDEFRRFLLDCGFHAMNVTPCSDGRLAHAIRYVLRLPMGAVQRRANAGALFDIEEALGRWSAVELGRFREGVPNTADAPTCYLKVAVYHYSSHDPKHQGCAAHGSDTREAAAAGRERLPSHLLDGARQPGQRTTRSGLRLIVWREDGMKIFASKGRWSQPTVSSTTGRRTGHGHHAGRTPAGLYAPHPRTLVCVAAGVARCQARAGGGGRYVSSPV